MNWICPRCKKENEEMICSDCGFDESKNYKKYAVLSKLTKKSQQTQQENRKCSKVMHPLYQLQNPRIVKDDLMEARQKVTWDCVWFGKYPQSEIEKNSNIYLAMEVPKKNDHVYWWLRLPGRHAYYAVNVNNNGAIVKYTGWNPHTRNLGVRPTLNLNFLSSQNYIYAGTVCSDGTESRKIWRNN